MGTPPTSSAIDAPPENDVEVRRYRVVAGCTDCASDLNSLRRVVGVRDVRLLAATGVVAVEAATTVDDAVLLRTAASSGLTLEPERIGSANAGPKKRKSRWWLRRELVFLAIAAVLLAATEVAEYVFEAETTAKVLALCSIAIGIIYPARNAWSMLRSRKFSFNVLLVVTVIGALYLDRAGEAADLVVIFSLGAVLESYVADRARGSIRALMELSPPMAERFTGDGITESVPVEDLKVGDIVLVRPGSRLPTDGVVIEGTSWIDASAITGESMPVEVGVEGTVFGGTLNGSSALRVEVTKPYVDTVLARVIKEVEEAQANRGRAQRFADKFANIYTPAMIVLAVLVTAFGPLVAGLTFTDALYRSLVVLIVSCSCALVLSVPVSVVSAVARAARDGVLIKGGAYLERLATVNAVAFDKTGTLTLGRPTLVATHALNGHSPEELLSIAANVEAGATHPIAEAIVRAAREQGLTVRPLPDARTVAGIGAEAVLDGRLVTVGRVREHGADSATTDALAAIEKLGATPVEVIDDGHTIGLLGVADELRPDAHAAVDGLRELGVTHTVMLTGDRTTVARSIADRLGIDEVRAQLMPEDKSAAIEALRKDNSKGSVAMVGDGVNDAPALATADVAVVMGAAGTDVALETADVALMADDLTKLPYAVALARRARRNINQNIVLSLAMVVVLVTAALTGAFTLTEGVLINEGYALVVIANGLRLLRRRGLVAAPAPASTPATQPSRIELATVSSSCGCAEGSACGTETAAAAAEASSDCGCGPAASEPVAPVVATTSDCGCSSCGTDEAGTSAAPGASPERRS
ncbi:heavy metal translocating P-type ATPase [Amycolatopsis sp. NPDC004747]